MTDNTRQDASSNLGYVPTCYGVKVLIQNDLVKVGQDLGKIGAERSGRFGRMFTKK